MVSREKQADAAVQADTQDQRVGRHRAVFTAPPEAVPMGNVDVSGNGRWRVWEFAGTKIDAPILGNGDMLSAFAGPPRWPQFWVTTNDFWQMESNANYEFFHDNSVSRHDPAVSLGSPRPLGRLVFDIPALENAGYHAEQDFLTATTQAVFRQGDKGDLHINAWVAAGENILVTEFCSAFDAELSVSFLFPDELGMGCNQGIDFTGVEETDKYLNGTFAGLIGGRPQQVKKRARHCPLSGWRGFEERVDVPTRLAFAGRFVRGDEDGAGNGSFMDGPASVTIRAGKPLYFVLALRSWDKVSRPYESACARVCRMTPGDICQLRGMHLLWWREYWAVSSVVLDDPVVEQRYYLSQYMMGSLSRDPDYPPNILGISTFDRMAWNGNYKINYNHQSPYLGLLVSGHFEQADTHDAPYFAIMDVCREMARRLLGHDGVYLPLGLGPKGMVSEALLLHMKSPAVHGATNMLLRYSLTRDRTYAMRIYPFLRAVADFWEQDLVLEGEHYRIIADGMHEKTTSDVKTFGMPENPVNTLGYLKMFFGAMPDISEDLSLDAERRTKWRDIHKRLSDYPTATVAEIGANYPPWRGSSPDLRDIVPADLHDKKIFVNEERGSRWTVSFPANIMHIYPAGAIGLNSPPALLETARNTIAVRSHQEKRMFELGIDPKGRNTKTGAWNDGNLSCLFFPAAVRCAYDPELIWTELRDRILDLGLPNGFIAKNPHGIENLSTVPNTIQEMMLLSHEGIIRVFRVWPRISHPDASFSRLWADGGFQVSAALSAGEVSQFKIVSRAGQRCTVENPWPGHTAVVRSGFGRDCGSFAGGRIEFDTAPGESFTIEKE
jgi:hypothetical protein